MLNKSYFNLLNVDAYSSDRCVLPRVISEPGIISDFDYLDDQRSKLGSPMRQQRIIIVANQLPIKVYKQEDFSSSSSKGKGEGSSSKWLFDWDRDALSLQLKDGFSPKVEVFYVGSLSVEIDKSEQDEVAQLLLDRFNCVPTFLSSDLIDKFYHGFCKHYLWPLFHYMLPMTPNHGVRFDKSMWRAYVSANLKFADRVREVLDSEEDYVWIHDYHLMILPTLLRRRYHRIKLGFFLHSPFPSSEIYRTLPVREEILVGLLNYDLLGFQSFDYARHFLSTCSRMLGLEYQSKRGYIGLDYYGRTVCIKILPVGIHLGQVQSLLSLPDTAVKIMELQNKYKGKIVLLGVDDVDMFKGIGFKLRAMGQLLEEHPDYRGKVVLVQVLNAPRSRGQDIREVQDEIHQVTNEVNEKYGSPHYKPIVCVNGPVSFQDKVAYYSIAECVVVNCVRDGMNLVPYKYTVSREGSPELDQALGLKNAREGRKSVIIVSEFIGCSPSLSGAIRVNPWDVSSVAVGMVQGIQLSDSEKEMRHEKHYNYIKSHDVAYWARSFDQDLERACAEHFQKKCWGFGFALDSRVVALGPNFRKLSLDHIVPAYRKTNGRLILLDYDGTMLPESRIDKTPDDGVIRVLNRLCNDPKNVVFIVSGRDKVTLANWFSQCGALGLSAEHGFFTRWNRNAAWKSTRLPFELDWKKIVLPVMEHYTEATDGSYIEQKESALVWNYGRAASDFGSWQAKELLDHLESVLANDPVIVTKGRNIVEVKPQGVSKGVAVKNLVETMRSMGKVPGFVLCIGDDRSDEDMFDAVANLVANHLLPCTAEVFACTVGHKPSMAKYYLEDTYEVMETLRGLLSAPVREARDVKAVETVSVGEDQLGTNPGERNLV